MFPCPFRTFFPPVVLYCNQYAKGEFSAVFSVFMRLAVTVAAIPLCATYYPGVHMQDLPAALLAGAVLGVLYAIIRPIARLLLKILNWFTVGLLYVLIDTWLVWTATAMYPEAVTVDSFWWAVAIAVSVNIARMLIDIVTRSTKK